MVYSVTEENQIDPSLMRIDDVTTPHTFDTLGPVESVRLFSVEEWAQQFPLKTSFRNYLEFCVKKYRLIIDNLS